ncbi:protein serine/threonine phosphatase [Aureococcus anophagefferens]|nr:protein serine/threonine phosphatase [Aureococcus anophagefferens]
MLQKAAETTPGFRLVGDAAISADDLGWSCALIDGVLDSSASTALGYWGEFREAATPYADDHWDFDVGALRRDGYAILRAPRPSGARPAPHAGAGNLTGQGHDLRTDRVHWVDGSAAPAFAGAVGALKSVAAYLNGHFAKKNGRHVTAILYLNEHWDEADGGALELYPDSVDDAAVQRVLLGQAGRAWTPADERNLEAALAGHRRVEVWPEAGTVVVFDSRLVHTVRPAKRDRRAHALMSKPADGDAPRGPRQAHDAGGEESKGGRIKGEG